MCNSPPTPLPPFLRLLPIPTGKVHGSLARAGKVKGQTPKVPKMDKKKKMVLMKCAWRYLLMISEIHCYNNTKSIAASNLFLRQLHG